MIVGVVRTWNDDEAWGVLDSPETPGGCWAHLSDVARPGPWYIASGQAYNLEWEKSPQDGFDYRAIRLWPVGTEPVDPITQDNTEAYRSSVQLRFD